MLKINLPVAELFVKISLIHSSQWIYLSVGSI